MIIGEAIAEVLNSYEKAMMKYDEEFDLSLKILLTLSIKQVKIEYSYKDIVEVFDLLSEMLLTLSIRSDTECNEIRRASSGGGVER